MLIDAKTGKIRYGRIITCTDADTDGVEITNFLLRDVLKTAPEYHRKELIWKLFLPLFRITTKTGEFVFLFSKYEYDAWVKEHFDEIQGRMHCKGANSISGVVSKNMKTGKYLKQFAYKNADQYKLNACSEQFSLINTLSHEFAETSDKNRLIYSFDDHANDKMTLDEFYHFFCKQTILQKAQRHFPSENDLWTPTQRKMFHTMFLVAVQSVKDNETIKTLMASTELFTRYKHGDDCLIDPFKRLVREKPDFAVLYTESLEVF